MRLSFDMDVSNDAFQVAPEVEVARIFRSFAEALELGGVCRGKRFSLRDINGNTVGTATFI